jgi:hypothetical protein
MQANGALSGLFPAYNETLSASVHNSLHETFASADRFMLKLLVLHWVAAATVAGIAYSTYLFGFVAGGSGDRHRLGCVSCKSWLPSQ